MVLPTTVRLGLGFADGDAGRLLAQCRKVQTGTGKLALNNAGKRWPGRDGALQPGHVHGVPGNPILKNNQRKSKPLQSCNLIPY